MCQPDVVLVYQLLNYQKYRLVVLNPLVLLCGVLLYQFIILDNFTRLGRLYDACRRADKHYLPDCVLTFETHAVIGTTQLPGLTVSKNLPKRKC